VLIGVLWPLLCTWQAKWAERPPKAKSKMKQPSDRPTPRFKHGWATPSVCDPKLSLDHGGTLETEWTEGYVEVVLNEARWRKDGQSHMATERSCPEL